MIGKEKLCRTVLCLVMGARRRRRLRLLYSPKLVFVPYVPPSRTLTKSGRVNLQDDEYPRTLPSGHFYYVNARDSRFIACFFAKLKTVVSKRSIVCPRITVRSEKIIKNPVSHVILNRYKTFRCPTFYFRRSFDFQKLRHTRYCFLFYAERFFSTTIFFSNFFDF